MPDDSQIHFYGAIEKFDTVADGSLMVSGIASTESVDHDGEIVTADAMRKALPSYLQSGTVREMHQPIAAGCPISAHVDDDGRTHFTAKIVDTGTIAKIKANVLKGFSIGGKSLKKAGNKITELLLRDISVVDLPNNPETVFNIVKFEKPFEQKLEPKEPKIEPNHSMTPEELQKMDTLTKTVETLSDKVETLSKSTPTIPVELTKALADIGDLQKVIGDTQAKQIDFERASIISKMEGEGRVVFNELGVACKPEELQKMELPVLKLIARNAATIPLTARARYFGGSPDDVKKFVAADGKTPLTGAALVEAGFDAAGYDDLDKMIARATKN
jgi:hypothetical protein